MLERYVERGEVIVKTKEGDEERKRSLRLVNPSKVFKDPSLETSKFLGIRS